jgi:hypothetical protein
MVSDLFTPRALQNIDCLLRAIDKLDEQQRKIARFVLSGSLGQMSKMVFAIANRRSKGESQKAKQYEVGSWVIGYWRPKTFFEINVWHVFEGRAIKLANALKKTSLKHEGSYKANVKLVCQDAAKHLQSMKPGSVDLLVTDPPHSDRIPYLELSEMWNTFLGYTADLDSEFIYSNSPTRNKTLTHYIEKLGIIVQQVDRVLVEGGIFILIFNTVENEVWNAIQSITLSQESNLKYLGRFSADYSAGSVVQDNRKGALTNDWCLVFTKGDTRVNYQTHTLPSWTEQWINQ